MENVDIVSIISNLGFPIVCVGFLAWFVFYIYNKSNEEIRQMSETHKQETEALVKAVENNTLAVQLLMERIAQSGGVSK